MSLEANDRFHRASSKSTSDERLAHHVQRLLRMAVSKGNAKPSLGRLLEMVEDRNGQSFDDWLSHVGCPCACFTPRLWREQRSCGRSQDIHSRTAAPTINLCAQWCKVCWGMLCYISAETASAGSPSPTTRHQRAADAYERFLRSGPRRVARPTPGLCFCRQAATAAMEGTHGCAAF